MDSKKVHREESEEVFYFSMALHTSKERSKRVVRYLRSVPRNSKSDYVQTAILFYEDNKDIQQIVKHAVQEALAELIPQLLNSLSNFNNDSPLPYIGKTATEENTTDRLKEPAISVPNVSEKMKRTASQFIK